MKARLNPETAAALVMLAVVGVVALFTQRNDQPKYDTFASTDYASGGVRAWSVLLQREGVRTGRFVRRPVELDGTTDTLIVLAPLPFLARTSGRIPADIADLARWVRSGGRLVYAGRLLPQIEQEQLHLPKMHAATGRRSALHGPWLREAGGIDGFGTDRFERSRVPRGVAEVYDHAGALVVRYPLGRGEVVAVADAVPFTNGFIGRAGNARLAYLIARPARAGGAVAFDDGLHGALRDRPWYRALPIPVLVALGFAAAGIGLGLAGGALPSGPRIEAVPPREPTSAEFLAALAALYDRTHARDDARAVVTRDALAAAARRAGVRESAEAERIAEALHGRGDADAVERLAQALRTPVRGDTDLVAAAQLAYTIRKEFAHGGNGDERRSAFAGRLRAHRRRQ